MSSSKGSLSGLRTIKRDWSSSSKTDDDCISWPQPTPADALKNTLDARAQRLKDIQAGLDGRAHHEVASNPLKSYTNITTADIASGRKRPLPTPSNESAAQKRVLPAHWQEDVYTSSSNFTTSMRVSSVSRPATSSQRVTASAATTDRTSTKSAAACLSQEQTQILRLVEEGKSVFYTGSAGTGKSVLLREIIRTLRKKYVKSPDAVAITASTGTCTYNRPPWLRVVFRLNRDYRHRRMQHRWRDYSFFRRHWHRRGLR
ncbi:hypothetical protein PAXRUDRAFT_338561 [Paxillus rubicundulus Ve08.2h10]|uniref:ATP-dependent DNA helicase n=1 Tax=Paxillus rubicundulus Ve08.2h10 TaxID=930991 RepID=A0A0D0DER6_9AGAM|nr:hypothetical protein PAXRUDRAFT_338561 [Paxillus rubicundulus Ve08.2h10]